ncbi:tRNA (adenosine(37)-N6)-threonylcarbamoyltransferase complex transferase subunit TsaD [Candidatus Uhrbacteria bacterium]|nr:tRNA (adenosine(37)-N6)-threonylcarbamoyltransferase complex transferase subunit TsaD [Candidatus Uhrbacteria bacterium]
MKQSAKQFNPKVILAIETSCDETAIAVLEANADSFRITKSLISSQQDIHMQYGGVVPEVAARAHITTIIPLIRKGIGRTIPDAIAVTAGPGLITSLLVGVHTARALSYIYRKPLIRVNHIEGHIYANFLEKKILLEQGREATIPFPALVLIVSGGHTELILMKDHGQYQRIGKTLDDAAGEAFDKAAKIFNLPYPGGPSIANRAVFGDPFRSPLPFPMLHSGNCSFSFSGLKTAVLYRVRDLKKNKHYSPEMRDHLCASFQHSVVSVLVAKTIRAAKQFGVASILLGGGVAANIALRESLARAVSTMHPHTELILSPLQYCTDNAAMIAVAAFFKAKKKDFASPFACITDPSWDITDE